jgi:DNA-binding transcriptional MocR family regulator
LRRTVESNLLRAQTLIARHFPHDTRVSRPQGGFLLWLQMPPNIDAISLYQAAINAGISIAPGPLFSPQEKFRNCFRLSVPLPWDNHVENALVRLGELVGSQAVLSDRSSRRKSVVLT